MKVKSLAAEARIIRHEEKRQRGSLRGSLHAHRTEDVRQEQRASLLAYAMIRGRPYAQAEQTKRLPPKRRIIQLVRTFGFREFGPKPTEQEAANLVQSWMRPDPSGRDLGVMTLGNVGSTPAGRTTTPR